MGSVFSGVREQLPAPVAAALQRWRRRLAFALSGVQFNELRVDAAGAAERARDEAVAALRTAVDDLLVRQDTILASYDRRVAALTNKVLELEELLKHAGRNGQVADANRVVAEHAAGSSTAGE